MSYNCITQLLSLVCSPSSPKVMIFANVSRVLVCRSPADKPPFFSIVDWGIDQLSSRGSADVSVPYLALPCLMLILFRVVELLCCRPRRPYPINALIAHVQYARKHTGYLGSVSANVDHISIRPFSGFPTDVPFHSSPSRWDQDVGRHSTTMITTVLFASETSHNVTTRYRCSKLSMRGPSALG